MNDVQIKKATIEDLELLLTISRQSYSENFAHHWNDGGLEWYLEAEYGPNIIKDDLHNDEITYFIASFGNEPAGFMKLHLARTLPGYPARSGMEVEKLYFRPPFQGRGIGKKLIHRAVDLGQKLNREIVWLHVIDTNDKAIEFYKNMGFAIHDKTRLDIPYFKEELKGVWRMVLKLD